MQVHKTIPEVSRPKKPPTVVLPANDDLDKAFWKDYQSLYFSHLERAITHTTIALEIAKAKGENILLHTQCHLCERPECAATIKEKHQQFLQNNNIDISVHQTLPELKTKLTTAATEVKDPASTSLPKTRARKKK